ncbi:hypothetical protein [Halobellus sp. Atlit-38R]|nr:hypothetical protein [Halobellus sp. Atlit-38R]
MAYEGDHPRITDLSALDAEDFKIRNTKFLRGDRHCSDKIEE